MKKMKEFVVIGLGRFGKSVASQLYTMGNEVLAIDKNPIETNQMDGKVSSAITADATKYEILHSLGVENFDCAIVCIGEALESSLLVVEACKELKIGYIIAKAKSEQHAKILKALGVDLIVSPEEFAGKKLTNMLATPGINELAELTEDYKIFEMALPDGWRNKTIRDINMTKKYKVSIIVIKRENAVLIPDPDMELIEGDKLVLSGESSKFYSLINLIKEPEEVKQSLTSVFENKDEDNE
jgi:trk system potassium uptake protein TrkA